MRRLLSVGLVFVLAQGARAEVLENDYVRLTVDPGRGGAVTSMTYKKAVHLRYLVDRGAGVAGTGSLFTSRLQVSGQTHDLAGAAMKAQAATEAGDRVLRLTVSLVEVSPGLSLERTIRLGKEESGFRVRDVFRNDGPGARDLTFEVGGRGRQQPEPWCLCRRCSFGDASRSLSATSAGARGPETVEARSPRLFWRVSGPFGVGFLYQVTAPRPSTTLTHRLPKEPGHPADFEWSTGPVRLPAGQTLAVPAAVLIDEGAHGGDRPPAPASGDRVLVAADLRAAGESGGWLPGFGSVVSALPRKVKMVASQYYLSAGREDGRTKLGEADLVLTPGKAEFRAFDVRPTRTGLLQLEIAVVGEHGELLARSTAPAVIDGGGPAGERAAVWKRYRARLPEVHARGSWAEIGEQLAKLPDPGPLKPGRTPDPKAAERLAFYEKHFPYYADLLKGAARALRVKPEQPAARDADPQGPAEACMGVFFNGPDGPINAFSKERGGTSLGGLGYVKVVPDQGYRYHMYTLNSWSFGYGVNSEGLCTSGATINCDARTEAAGGKATQEWKRAGRLVAPMGTHLMLATCKDVAEAIRFIENPVAPFEFTGNMLLVDRAGNAAVLESVGIFHQIRRPDGKGVFATGNYAHERKDGLFRPGANWGWAANTMLRERLLDRVVAEKNGRVGLRDAFRIMETHAQPGGMCQHVTDNPGLLYSSTSYLAVARTSELYISSGPPCTVHYERYALLAGPKKQPGGK